MSWIFHGNFKTEVLAEKYGKIVIEARLAKGIKIVSKKKGRKKVFELHILPITKGD